MDFAQLDIQNIFALNVINVFAQYVNHGFAQYVNHGFAQNAHGFQVFLFFSLYPHVSKFHSVPGTDC